MRSIKRVFSTAGALATAMLLMTSMTANAAVTWIVDGTGQLIGANGVDIGGEIYNVEFLSGTCVELFSGCDEETDFDFDTQAQATQASQALLDQVFLDVAEGNFDSAPQLTFGCFFRLDLCQVQTTANLDGFPTVQIGMAQNWAPAFGSDVALGSAVNATQDTTVVAANTWARWTLVPEPATTALLGLGLFGITLSRRRKRA